MLDLGVGELEHDIGGDLGEVAAHLRVQPAGLDAIERGEVGIEQDLAAAYEKDAALDALDRDDRTPALAYSAPMMLHHKPAELLYGRYGGAHYLRHEVFGGTRV